MTGFVVTFVEGGFGQWMFYDEKSVKMAKNVAKSPLCARFTFVKWPRKLVEKWRKRA